MYDAKVFASLHMSLRGRSRHRASRCRPCHMRHYRRLERGLEHHNLESSDYTGAPASRRTIWAPAHVRLEGNEMADDDARTLTLRAMPFEPSNMNPEPNPSSTFREIIQFYRFSHAIYPNPCKGLTKAEKHILLHFYINTLLCPTVLKHFDSA